VTAVVSTVAGSSVGGAAVTFAVVLPALLVAHTVADHWVQTDHQAGHKGLPGWAGRWACGKHVATGSIPVSPPCVLPGQTARR
jgi:hypothetical protein